MHLVKSYDQNKKIVDIMAISFVFWGPKRLALRVIKNSTKLIET